MPRKPRAAYPDPGPPPPPDFQRRSGKADIVDALVGGIEGMSKKRAAEVVDILFATIAEYLEQERVQIPAFGSFSVSRRAARKGRTLATGRTIKTSKVVRFKAGKALKNTINKK